MSNTHTLTTTITGSKNSQKGVNSQVDYQNHNTLPPPPPPKGLSFTGLRTQLKSSARHTLSNQQAQPKEAETFNLTEYDVRYIFKATKQGALKVTLHHFLLLGNSKHHTQHDIINSTATLAPFTLIMLHS